MKHLHYAGLALSLCFIGFGLSACQDQQKPVENLVNKKRDPNTVLFTVDDRDLQLKNGVVLDAATQQPINGEVKGGIPQVQGQRLDAKAVNGKWEGEYNVYMTAPNGKEYLAVKRNYKNGKEVGSTLNYFPSGKVQAEFKFKDDGSFICAINFDESGKQTQSSCK